MKMYELLYTSVSPKGLSDSELADILQTARLFNSRIGVTGMLVYYDHENLQLLEGEEKSVKSLFEKIRSDERHTSVEVFHQGNIDQRSFTSWAMAFQKLNNHFSGVDASSFEELRKGISPRSMVKSSPNRGKQFLLSLLDSYLS